MRLRCEHGEVTEALRTVEIRVSDMHVIYTLPRETRRNLLSFLLEIKNYRQEFFDVRRRDIISVRPLDERFALQVEDGNQAGHGDVGVVVESETTRWVRSTVCKVVVSSRRRSSKLEWKGSATYTLHSARRFRTAYPPVAYIPFKALWPGRILRVSPETGWNQEQRWILTRNTLKIVSKRCSEMIKLKFQFIRHRTKG